MYVDTLVERDRDAGGLEERLWVQQDANFNVTALTDGTGAAVERFVYDPFGAATVLTGAFAARPASLYAWQYLHQGGRVDGASGLVHFRMRDYSPTLGQWVTMDPIGYEGGDTNLFRGVGNNPANALDPRGLSAFGRWVDRRAEDFVRGSDVIANQLGIGDNAATNAWAGPSVRTEQPSLGVSLIPIYGSANQAEYHLSRGEYFRAAAYTLLAASDVVMAGTILKAGGKALVGSVLKLEVRVGQSALTGTGKLLPHTTNVIVRDGVAETIVHGTGEVPKLTIQTVVRTAEERIFDLYIRKSTRVLSVPIWDDVLVAGLANGTSHTCWGTTVRAIGAGWGLPHDAILWYIYGNYALRAFTR